MGGTKLTDKQEQEAIAAYVEWQNYGKVAEKFGVAPNTIRNIIRRNGGVAEKCKMKKRENTADILQFMDKKTSSAKRFAEYILDNRLNPEENRDELDGMSIPQLVTAFGIVLDKFLRVREIEIKKDEGIPKSLESDNLFESIGKAIKNVQ